MTDQPMTTSRPAARELAWPLLLALVLAGVAFFLYQRNAGLQPSVFADEWYYSKMSRLTPLADSMLPSYLYLWLFGASSACGTGFLDCVRLGNLAFFIGAAPFVYLVARRYAGKPLAAAVALLSTLAPLNSFTAYFMPETMYYFGFCVLSWVALTGGDWRPSTQALASGLVLGLMSLVKVHALFLLPALCPFLLLASHQRGGAWLLRGLAMAALAAVLTFALKFGLGYVFAGKNGLSIFGYFYESTKLGVDRLALLAAASVNARGHLMTLALVYGLPLAILGHALGARLLSWRGAQAAAAHDPATARRELLHLYTLLMLGAAAGLTVMYTAGLHVPGSREGFRLHLRYYSFVFPLLAVVAAAAVAPGQATAAPRRPWLRWALAALLGAIVLLALSRLQGYTMNVVDGPDIFGINLAGKSFRILVGLQLLLLLGWAARVRLPGWTGTRLAPLLFVCLALPAAYAASYQGVGRHLATLRTPTPTDMAAVFTREHVPAAERGDVVIAGLDLSLMIRAQFHIDHPDTTLLSYEGFGPLAEYQLPLHKKWMVLLGDFTVPDEVLTLQRTPWYSVVRLPDPGTTLSRINLALPPDPAVLTGIEGLSRIEPWGRWSDAKQVVFHFARPLPRRVGVLFNARAYDVNAQLPFQARVGGVSKEFRVGWHMREFALHFDTDGTARTLVIDVPQPVSPAERGQPGDTRPLGIGIGEIVITDGSARVEAAR